MTNEDECLQQPHLGEGGKKSELLKFMKQHTEHDVSSDWDESMISSNVPVRGETNINYPLVDTAATMAVESMSVAVASVDTEATMVVGST